MVFIVSRPDPLFRVVSRDRSGSTASTGDRASCSCAILSNDRVSRRLPPVAAGRFRTIRGPVNGGWRGSLRCAPLVVIGGRVPVHGGYGGWRYAETVMERVTRATAQVPAVPGDLDTTEVEKPTGVVELPLHIRWSGPPRSYDLGVRRERARVYEQVLREGNEDDVRRFIRTDELIDLWDELVLPRNVRRAWADWLQRHRRVALSC